MVYGILINLAAHSPFLNTIIPRFTYSILDLHFFSSVGSLRLEMLFCGFQFSFGKKQNFFLNKKCHAKAVWSNVSEKGARDS